MTDLSAIRVLVVEDEAAVAMMIEDMLEELGCIVVASVGQVARACEAAATAKIDLALLDVNLNGQLVFPVAGILRDRQIPFVFSTGYGARGVPAEFSDYGVLGKPFSQVELRQSIVSAMESAVRSRNSAGPPLS